VLLYSWNVNGVRSVASKGFAQWLRGSQADVVCLQETKPPAAGLPDSLGHPEGFRGYWHHASRPGYSGVALLSRREPLSVTEGLGVPEFDTEGRVITAEFPGFTLVNAYFPNSRRDHSRLDYKLRFCRAVMRRIKHETGAGRHVVLCGDFNIAHQPIDLRNPKQNENNAGFLPQERAWMGRLLAAGFIDPFRERNPEAGHYTWWSYRPGVRERNIGWRLDYFVTDSAMADRVAESRHHPRVMGSDHCPVSLLLRD